MINLARQGQQAAQLAGWEAFARKPVQVVARQVGYQAAFVFTVGHGHGHQFLQVFGLHSAVYFAAPVGLLALSATEAFVIMKRMAAFGPVRIGKLARAHAYQGATCGF